MMRELAQPCIKITSERVSDRPLRRNPLVSLFGGRAAEPVLGVAESKFGGIPYCDPDESWDDNKFLMQIDLARATAVLPPHAPKLEGLLRIDIGPRDRVRWFREVDPSRVVSARPQCVAAYEARLRFALGWTIPEGDELDQLWPLTEPCWYEYERFFPSGYNDDGENEYHRMMGFRSTGLEGDIGNREQLLRICADDPADFHWGTNWLYVLVPRDELRVRDLQRATLCIANS